jgi:hypothetical protein
VLATVIGIAIGAAGCSSQASVHPRRLDAQQTGAGGAKGLAAQPPQIPTSLNTVRLGFVTSADDGIALVGVGDGLFREDIGVGAVLQASPLGSPTTVQLALERGQIDAAYLDPVAAVAAWQATHGRIRVMAGAASADGKSSVVLAVTTRLLILHPVWVEGLLKGQIQAMQLLDTYRASGRRIASAELSALGRQAAAREFTAASAKLTFTCNPLQASVLDQARQAATAGTLQRFRSLTGMYDLVPVDVLLHAAGLQPVSGRG